MLKINSILFFSLLNCFLLLFSTVMTAQENYVSREYQQENIKKNSRLNKEKWKSLSKNFDYSNERKPEEKEPQEIDAPPPNPTTVRSATQSPTLGGEVLKYGLFGLIILILAFIVIRLIAGGSIFNNKKVEKGKVFTLDDIEDNLHEINVESFLNDALSQRDFRLAIRLYYLSILKGLSLNGKIQWKKDKTNGAYLREMYTHPNIAEFREVTYIYEYVWFNEEVPFDADNFEKVRAVFRNMLNIAEQSSSATKAIVNTN